MKLNHKYYFIFAALLFAFILLPLFGDGGGKQKEKIKVACIGDSITFGARLENPEKDSYPARLQGLLGERYLVENFGVGSCTLIRKGIPTVWDQLSKIKAANPDIVVISLGTNDTCGFGSCGDRKCWEYKDEFEGDYSDLIDTLRTWPSPPLIWICAPTPMVLETPGMSAERIQGLTEREPRLQELIGIIKKVAENKKVGFIDLNTPLKGKPEFFTVEDGVHPNKDGYFAIAKLVYQEVKKEGMSISAQPEKNPLFFKDRLQPLTEKNIFKTEDYFNWCSSVIKGDDGKYHLFYSRWPKKYTFLSWLTHSEIAHAMSDSPAGPWEYKETVLQSRGKGHWDAITVHNPKIKKFGDKYYLYYVSTNMGDQDYTEEELIETARVGYKHPNWTEYLRPNQRTGVAVAESINGPWKRMDKPLIEPSGPITTLTVNPAVAQGKDGKFYLIVKGDKPNATGFVRNQAVAISGSPTGPFKMQPGAVIDDMDTEDMSVWYDAGRERFYGVFHAHSFIGMINSPDGINWRKATEYVVQNKRIPFVDGSELVPERMERPFIYQEDGEPKVLSLAVKKGNESYIVFIPVEEKTRPQPNKRQLAWQKAELGAVFHYDLHVFDGKKYGQGHNRINPVEDYQIFNPQQLDTDQWIKAIKDAGFTFAILTATHETGFALYQSKVNPYSMKALNFQNGEGDIVRDFVNSCRKYGIKPGIYLGIRWNSFFGVHDFKVNGTGEFRENRQRWYNQMVEGMVEEICTNYGELFEIWFDGGADHPGNGAPDVLPIVQRYQPNCLFYHNKQLAEARWGGSESGTVSYPCWATFPYFSTGAGESAHEAIAKNNFQLLKQGDPDGKYWMPAMSDAPLRGYNGRHEWFWEPGDEEHIFPLENLMNMYYKSVGHNSTLIIGLTPNPDGLMPDPDVKRLKEWGDEIKRQFSNPIASISGKGKELKIRLPERQLISQVVIQEDIAQGERVRKFVLEGKTKNGWHPIFEGSCIGHKFIHRFDKMEVDEVRLRIPESTGEPQIKTFQVFNVN